ncbi:MAG: uracil-DNA glycosylase [Firmicutes bacterium]|nr:uracil-DNA glycosylase [Bacillota bacterium]
MIPLADRIVTCDKCPRLVAWRQDVARVKVRRFRDQRYWGKPLPGFGDPEAQLMVVGLAPAAHGGNRTGRMFTGDDSGAWLMAALHSAGFASQPSSDHRDDGLVLYNAYITAALRCAPPNNRPRADELEACRPYLLEEWQAMNPRVVVALGQIAFDAVLRVLKTSNEPLGKATFGHGARYDWDGSTRHTLIASYHPSRQNTQTGRLTRSMFESIFRTARAILTAEDGPLDPTAFRPPVPSGR